MTNAELAILSLVAEEPRHGYDIEQVIEMRGLREWTDISFSSIYYLLKKLEKDRLITSEVGPSKRGAGRKIYRITAVGQQALIEATLEALSVPQSRHSALLMGIANLPLLDRSQVRDALSQYQAALEDDISRVAARHDAQQPLPDHVEALFDLSLTQIRTELNWITGYLKQMEHKTMKKFDVKKTMKPFYNPTAKDFSVVDVPPMNFLMVDGAGNPGTTQDYQDALEALYAVSYALKFMSKKENEVDYVVPPLQGLWWADDMNAFTADAKDDWLWTMMIMQPDVITADMVERAIESVRNKKNPAALDKVRFEAYHEGLSVQIMHIGPYSEEGPTLHRLHHDYMPEQGYDFNGKHHEIYLSDPRRVAPEKMKTVLRQPVKPIK